jgi:hypothetical protein
MRIKLFLTATLAFLMFCSCGGNSALLAGTRDNKVKLLGEYCKAKNLSYQEVSVADLMISGSRDRNNAPGDFLVMEKAFFLYRIALLKYESENSKKELDSLQKTIVEDRAQLEKYAGIAEQLKDMRK